MRAPLVRRGHRARSTVRVRAGRPRRGSGVFGTGLPRRARCRGGGGARGRVRQRRARRPGRDPALEARRGAAHHAPNPSSSSEPLAVSPSAMALCVRVAAALGDDDGWRPTRVCELGSGTGAAGLLVARMLTSTRGARELGARPLVLLTDRDTAALEVIASNVRLNARGWARCVPQRLQWDRRDERSRVCEGRRMTIGYTMSVSHSPGGVFVRSPSAGAVRPRARVGRPPRVAA